MRLRLRALLTALLLGSLILVGHPAWSSPLRASAYYMPLDNDPQPISAITGGSGLRQRVLAFVLAPNGGGCTPTRPCTGNVGWVDGKCSGVTQQPFDFTEIITRFTG